jgi:hypothetical protein
MLACGTDDRPASWSYVHAAIIRPSCTTSSCHSSLATTAGLNFETRVGAYMYLTGRVCDGPELPGLPPRHLVAPGQPERSRLVYLLRGEDLRNMPPDGPLPPADVALIERWILEGALCD